MWNRTGLVVLLVVVIAALAACGGPRLEGEYPHDPDGVVQEYLALLPDHATGQKARWLFADWADIKANRPVVKGEMFHTMPQALHPFATHRVRGRHVNAAMSMDVTFYRMNEAEAALPDGPATWTYITVQENPGDRWRIALQGPKNGRPVTVR